MNQSKAQTLKRLWRLIKPFFFSEVKWQARLLLLLLVAFALSIAGVNFLLSYFARDFMTALSLKERDEFFGRFGRYLLIFALATPFAVFYSYTEQRLALLWRQWLSREMLQKYFSKLAFYRVGSYEGIDNPDQRIEEDIRSFTATSLSLFLIFLNAVLTLVLFVGILWTISYKLIVAVILYAVFGTIITYLVGRPLIQLNFTQLKREADYRYKLVNVRDNAESIAFYRGDRKELTRTRQRLRNALQNSLRIIKLNRNLNFFITGYNYLKPVVPLIVVAPLYLAGEAEFGVITQSADAFVRVVEALSILVQHFGTISAMTAVVTRLGSFSEALELAKKGEATGAIEVKEEDRIAFRSVTIYTPKRDQALLRDLSFTLEQGGLLITGTSGSGKSSIFRVIAGLWDAGEGSLSRPPLERCMFLPQRPYMVLGSLRNQLRYALRRNVVTDDELRHVLDQVGLDGALRRIGGFDATVEWSSILSTGEQQRLAFARLLLAKPDFAFLDEATTAVDSVAEEQLYTLLLKHTKAFVSIGYRSPLAQYHHSILELSGGGRWRLERRR